MEVNEQLLRACKVALEALQEAADWHEADVYIIEGEEMYASEVEDLLKEAIGKAG